MLPHLLRLRRVLHRVGLGIAALAIVLLLVRFLGPTPLPAPSWAMRYLIPVVSTFGIVYVWTEAALAGIDPESRFYVPDAPPFRATMFAIVGQMALWQSLQNAGYLFGWEGAAWITRKLDIAEAGLSLAGVIMLVEAWWERHSTHPLALGRRLMAALGGALALLIALPWESHSPIAADALKPWLYGALLLGTAVGLVMGWPIARDVQGDELADDSRR